MSIGCDNRSEPILNEIAVLDRFVRRFENLPQSEVDGLKVRLQKSFVVRRQARKNAVFGGDRGFLLHRSSLVGQEHEKPLSAVCAREAVATMAYPYLSRHRFFIYFICTGTYQRAIGWLLYRASALAPAPESVDEEGF